MKKTPVSELIQQMNGVDLSVYDAAFLSKALEKRMQAVQCASPEAYAETLLHNPAEAKSFLDSLHINYSEFFRDPLTFAVLERLILPELIQKKQLADRKEIRIWSAGCAAGQEAYSLAMLLEELLPTAAPKLNYRIFATDVSESALTEARQGCYNGAALSNISLKRAHTWFTRQGCTYTIQPVLQQKIDFSVFDLLDENRFCPPVSIFGDFDLVFCCNVLIYYNPTCRGLVLDKMKHCLAREARLVTGETERAFALAQQYTEVYPYAAIFSASPSERKRV